MEEQEIENQKHFHHHPKNNVKEESLQQNYLMITIIIKTTRIKKIMNILVYLTSVSTEERKEDS